MAGTLAAAVMRGTAVGVRRMHTGSAVEAAAVVATAAAAGRVEVPKVAARYTAAGSQYDALQAQQFTYGTGATGIREKVAAAAAAHLATGAGGGTAHATKAWQAHTPAAVETRRSRFGLYSDTPTHT